MNTTWRIWQPPTNQARGIDPHHRIPIHISKGIPPALQPDRVAFGVAAGGGIPVAVIIITQPGPGVTVLAGEAEFTGGNSARRSRGTSPLRTLRAPLRPPRFNNSTAEDAEDRRGRRGGGGVLRGAQGDGREPRHTPALPSRIPGTDTSKCREVRLLSPDFQRKIPSGAGCRAASHDAAAPAPQPARALP